RRKNIIDTDNNAADFESIDYRLPPTGITDEQAEFYRPKRSAEGPWDPVYVAPPPVASPGSVLIFQVYGSGTATDGAVSHNFIELYNTTAAAINLAGYSVQYAEEGTTWDKHDLTGTIPAFGSFLILGNNNNTGGRLQLNVAAEHTTADQAWTGRIINNQKFKIVLMQSTDFLTVADPFTGGADGTPVAGYMDMIGAVNGGSEALDAYETAKANVISKQKAARRKNLTDTNNNAVDFESIDYRSSGITNEQIPLYRPRNTAAGSWDPASPPTERLMIFQVYGPGNSDDPDGVFTDGAISHSFIELYNNTAASINLSGYSIQYSEGGTAWTKLDLTGAVPAHSSFLILGENHNISPRLDLTGQADQAWSSLEISRKRFKIALLSNTTLLTAANPFTGGTGGEPVAGYIDMLGSGDNDGSIPIDVFETSGAMIPCPTLLSKQKSARRKNLTDTDNNLVDFESRDFRADRMTADALKIYRPKNTAYGVWDTVNPTD
ncbi:MAG: lamin tail domain-containing protein, partial [Treponema sp.]|nr:lamin tail domain-containing protein [Treponema sp.]